MNRMVGVLVVEANLISPPSFRDAPLGAGPESILTIVVMDSGLALRAPRHDEGAPPTTAAAGLSLGCVAQGLRPSSGRSGPVRHRASTLRSRCRQWRDGSPPQTRSS